MILSIYQKQDLSFSCFNWLLLITLGFLHFTIPTINNIIPARIIRTPINEPIKVAEETIEAVLQSSNNKYPISPKELQ